MLVLLATLAAAADPAPAIVTTARGTVTLVEAGARKPAPAPPFLLGPGQSLDLAAGALVVVLRQGGAWEVTGPKIVDAASLRPPEVTADASALGDLLARRTSAGTAGASRAGGIAVVRPVPGKPTTALSEVRWRCDRCGEQAIELVDLRMDETVWTGKGTERVAYAGTPLHAGSYAVKVGGHEFAFTVTRPEDGARVKDALTQASVEKLDPNARAAATAALYLQAGLYTDALTALDGATDPELVAMRVEIEGRAGLVK